MFYAKYVCVIGLKKIGVRMGEKFYSKSEVIHRNRLLPPSQYHKTVVVWFSEINSLQRLLRLFTETAMFCFQYIDVGVYNPNDG